MKKQIIILSTLIALALTPCIKSMAQGKVWSIGPEIGANVSKYNLDNTKYKPGFVGGLFLTYSVENTHAFTGKLLFSQKGNASTLNNQTETLNYIELPLIARIFFNREGKFRPNIFVGPSFGYLASVYKRTGTSKSVKEENYTDSFNTFDFGVTGGLGFNYQIANETRLLIDARYTHGLTDISVADGGITNRVFCISAGISFGL